MGMILEKRMRKMRKIVYGFAALGLIFAATSCAGEDSQDPVEGGRESSAPAHPVIKRWVNVPCAPEGAKGITISGGSLICKKVGSDVTAEWHAVASAN
jgi:hypothetical protein